MNNNTGDLPLMAYSNTIWPKINGKQVTMKPIPGSFKLFKHAQVPNKVVGSLWEPLDEKDAEFQPNLVKELQKPSMASWIEKYAMPEEAEATISDDAVLASLTISAGSIKPSFSTKRTNYTAEVVDTVQMFTVKGKTRHERAKIRTINGMKVNSSRLNQELSLEVDEDKTMLITVSVEAQDGHSVSEYTIKVVVSL